MKDEIIIFGGSFDPLGLHHLLILLNLRLLFPKARIIIVPCGYREDKNNRNVVSAQRIELVETAIAHLVQLYDIELDTYDLINDCFTPTHKLDERYSQKGEVWHFIGTDIIEGGYIGESEIHKVWARNKKDFDELKFIVCSRVGTEWSRDDLPPRSKLIKIFLDGSSTEIRRLCAANDKSFQKLVGRDVAELIMKNELYGWKN